MKKILLLSDTHFCVEKDILKYFDAADELWHAGDWGNAELSDMMEKTGKPIRSVYGNIDGQDIRQRYPLINQFECEGIKVYMTHIGGYPGKYSPGIAGQLRQTQADLFIAGHSHILRVMRDATSSNNMLFMNPGAAGRHGFHIMRTMLTFDIHQGKISNVAVIELGKRTAGILPDLQ